MRDLDCNPGGCRMSIARRIETIIAGSSWIRRMFEEGSELKKQHGAENVFDFSLGNPNLPPPAKFEEVLKELIGSEPSGAHAYMPNTGYPEVCGAVAGFLAAANSLSSRPSFSPPFAWLHLAPF